MRTRLPMLVTAICAAAAIATVGAAAGSTKGIPYKATLSTSQEIPKPTKAAAGAKGSFNATLSGRKLTWKLSYAGLTGPATATYLHFGTKSESGTILLAFCAPCKSPSSGTKKLTAAELTDLTHGKTYVSIHTFKNPRGEIRGQIVP